MDDRVPYSVVILWDDTKPKGLGAYTWAGLAHDEDDAEIEARTAMLAHRIDERGLTGNDARAYAESFGDVTNFGGSVVAVFGGINILATQDLHDELIRALPYVETAMDDPVYRPTAVAKDLHRIKAAISKSECKG